MNSWTQLPLGRAGSESSSTDWTETSGLGEIHLHFVNVLESTNYYINWKVRECDEWYQLVSLPCTEVSTPSEYSRFRRWLSKLTTMPFAGILLYHWATNPWWIRELSCHSVELEVNPHLLTGQRHRIWETSISTLLMCWSPPTTTLTGRFGHATSDINE